MSSLSVASAAAPFQSRSSKRLLARRLMALNDFWQPSKASRIAGAATFATRLAERAVLPSPVTLSAYATCRPGGGPARFTVGPAPPSPGFAGYSPNSVGERCQAALDASA